MVQIQVEEVMRVCELRHNVKNIQIDFLDNTSLQYYDVEEVNIVNILDENFLIIKWGTKSLTDEVLIPMDNIRAFSPALNKFRDGTKAAGDDRLTVTEFLREKTTFDVDKLKKSRSQAIESTKMVPLKLDPAKLGKDGSNSLIPLITYLDSKGRRFDKKKSIESRNVTCQAVPLGINKVESEDITVTRMEFALGSVMESLEDVILNGKDGFKGLYNMAMNKGYSLHLLGEKISVEDIKNTYRELVTLQKGYGTFIVTDSITADELETEDRMEIMPGITVKSVVIPAGDMGNKIELPVIVSPHSPSKREN